MTEYATVYVPDSENGTQANGSVKKKTVQVHVSPDRLDDIKVKDWIEVEKGKITGMARLVAYFIWNGHSYLPLDEALEVVNEMTTNELKETANLVMQATKDNVATKK